MIRKTIQNELSRALDGHKCFNSNDFIQTYVSNKIKFQYEYNEEYYLIFHLPDKTTTKIVTKKVQTRGFSNFGETREENVELEVYEITGSICPGHLTLVEELEFEGKGKLKTYVSRWLNSIWDELQSEPIARSIKDQNIIIDELKLKVDEMSDEMFTSTESEELKKKLEELEEKFKFQIESQIEDKNIVNSKLSELRNEIEVLKETLIVFDKKSWFKISMTKLYKWVSNKENQKILKGGVDLLKPLLPEPIQQLVD